MRKPAFSICENKGAYLIFLTLIVQSLFFINLKFNAPSFLQSLYSPVCVGPGWKPRRQVLATRLKTDKRLGKYNGVSHNRFYETCSELYVNASNVLRQLEL